MLVYYEGFDLFVKKDKFFGLSPNYGERSCLSDFNEHIKGCIEKAGVPVRFIEPEFKSLMRQN